jgi:transcriptional regulator with XRE-family HTH domain
VINAIWVGSLTLFKAQAFAYHRAGGYAKMPTAYADRIKELRAKRTWSQEELAIASDINVRTVQRVEKGDPVSADTLKALANAFEIDVTELVQAKVAPPAAGSDSMLLLRIRVGRDLFRLVRGAKAYGLDHGEIDTEMVDLVASFLQDVMDQADIGRYLGPGGWLRTYNQFTLRIQDLEDAGLRVFAMRQGEVATVYVVKSTDPGIVTFANWRSEGTYGSSGV